MWSFITLRASCGAVYCNRSCLWLDVCVCVGGSVTTITRNCMYRFSPNWVCRWRYSDHLQLVAFWPPRAPGKGSAVGRKFLAPPYCSQRAAFASLSAFLFVLLWISLFRQLWQHTIQGSRSWGWGVLTPWKYVGWVRVCFDPPPPPAKKCHILSFKTVVG